MSLDDHVLAILGRRSLLSLSVATCLPIRAHL